MQMNSCGCFPAEIYAYHGDIIEEYFTLHNVPKEAVCRVFFSCREKNLLIECPYSDFGELKGYCLRIPGEQAMLLTPQICAFDITAELINGEMITLLSDGCFAILKKRNPIQSEGGDSEQE